LCSFLKFSGEFGPGLFLSGLVIELLPVSYSSFQLFLALSNSFQLLLISTNSFELLLTSSSVYPTPKNRPYADNLLALSVVMTCLYLTWRIGVER